MIYLVFNEGYLVHLGRRPRSATSSPARRSGWPGSCATLLPDEPEVTGLLALMLLTEARRPSRVADGELVPLHEQDRGGWDRALIDEGHALVRECLAARPGRPGHYQLHGRDQRRAHRRAVASDTDWAQVAALYDQLDALAPSPDRRPQPGGGDRRARRARGGAGHGRPARPRDVPPWHVTRADLLRRLGRTAEARAAYDAAMELTDNEAERAYLTRRRGQLA